MQTLTNHKTASYIQTLTKQLAKTLNTISK